VNPPFCIVRETKTEGAAVVNIQMAAEKKLGAVV
jgi:hypothetical protein